MEVRASESIMAAYLVGDASGKGFGSAVWSKDSLFWESGIFSQAIREETSNFQEAINLIYWLEELERERELQGKEVFIFTDMPFLRGHSTKVTQVRST
jgi:hypothetical protein